uniref:Putative 16.8 kDa salivary secreted protein n=1 Tax=Corethrella appendiculata TaxID=1370023 RepID=U5ENN0_9DIPT
MKKIWNGNLLIVILFIFVNYSSACNGGYRLKVKSIQNCGGSDQVITLQPNSTAVITKDCKIKTRGCGFTKGFQSAVGEATVFKDGFLMLRRTFDVCDEMRKANVNSEIKPLMELFNVPSKCPVEEQTICSEPTQTINIEKYKQYLPLALGNIKINLSLNHDNGGKSCFSIAFEIVKV